MRVVVFPIGLVCALCTSIWGAAICGDGAAPQNRQNKSCDNANSGIDCCPIPLSCIPTPAGSPAGCNFYGDDPPGSVTVFSYGNCQNQYNATCSECQNSVLCWRAVGYKFNIGGVCNTPCGKTLNCSKPGVWCQ